MISFMRFVSKLGCLVLLASAMLPAAIPDPVRVESGQLSGIDGHDPAVRVFKGIPYAAPPVGELRWKAPKAAASWKGVRDAHEFSPTCMQTPYPEGSIYRSAPEPMNEDCLYLNVWTAAKAADERPVMVWIHGGALTRGSGSTPAYDGESLAKKGVVLVTINYRLGVFGFLAHPELSKESDRNASGNYAFLDQIAALEWVKRNIAAFGGDPNRVTIFGESAGSWSVNYLMATPLAKGLFQHAIGESGGTFSPMTTLAEAEENGRKFVAKEGAESIAALRAKPAEDLLKAGGSFPPNVDGWMLPEDVYTIFAKGKQIDVPLIAGSNADEATSLAPWPSNGTAAAYVAQTRRRFGTATDRFLKIYPAESDEQAKAAHYDSYRDLVFGWQMRTWVRMATETGKSKAFLYYFNRVPPGPGSDRLRVYHAAEILYVFDNLGASPRPWEDDDRKLADTMSSYWVNFAATGDPNGKDLPRWPVYRRSDDVALELGSPIKPVAHLHEPALDFFDAWYAGLRGGK